MFSFILGSSSKTPKSAKGTPVKLKKGEDSLETGATSSKNDTPKTDKNSKETAANATGKYKEAPGGGMSSGVESDNTQTNANSTPEETDAELATNDDEAGEDESTNNQTTNNEYNNNKEQTKVVTIEESNISNDTNSEVVDTAKEQEMTNNEILHSLITLLMKVIDLLNVYND